MKCPFLLQYFLHHVQCCHVAEAHPPIDVHTALGDETACGVTPISAGVGIAFLTIS